MLHAPLATHFKEAKAAYHCALRYQKQSTQQVAPKHCKLASPDVSDKSRACSGAKARCIKHQRQLQPHYGCKRLGNKVIEFHDVQTSFSACIHATCHSCTAHSGNRSRRTPCLPAATAAGPGRPREGRPRPAPPVRSPRSRPKTLMTVSSMCHRGRRE
jgi:hypothetical protein